MPAAIRSGRTCLWSGGKLVHSPGGLRRTAGPAGGGEGWDRPPPSSVPRFHSPKRKDFLPKRKDLAERG